MGAEPLLSVRDLKTYFFADEGTTRAVDGVSFDVRPGRTLGIVGETGCGKSVTARSILRIVDRPGRIVGGQILLRRDDGVVDLAALPAKSATLREVRGGEIGLVFQEPMTSFSPVHTVGDQLMEAVRLHAAKKTAKKTDRKTARKTDKRDNAAVRARAVELLDMVGVPRPEERLAAYPWQLSGGLLQRAMIAMALAGDPRLLIADEPTTALDVITQAQILDLIRDLQEHNDLGIILITHDLGVVAQMADDVAVMYLGRVAEQGRAETIFSAPRHPYTQALLESIPSVHHEARMKLPTITGGIPHPFDRPAGCAFHTRCRHTVPGVCNEKEPDRRVLAGDHESRCHLEQPPVFTLTPTGYGTGNGERLADNGSARVTVVEPTAPALLEVAEPAPEPAAEPAPEPEPLLRVRHLVKHYALGERRFGRPRGTLRAVDDVGFDLREGETLALVGESGSGKTTASRCILRAVTPESGDIFFRARSGDVVNLATVRRKDLRALRPEIQMVFQDPYSSLNPRMTVLDIIGEPLLVNGVRSRQQRVDRVEELLGLVGLRPEYMRRFPHAFSGGQRQRIGIARALASGPRVVVADEPVSALDVSVQAQTLNLLMDLQERLGLTYLFVSHDLSVVRHIAERICVMYAGQLVESGPAASVLAAPRHPYTATLLAAVPKPDPRARARFDIPRAKGPEQTPRPPGCQFERRCPHATTRCAAEAPALRLISPGREVRCHHAEDLVLPVP
ncbi:MAG TPA: ABC transporter ATP-binding protein [Streptosporangiaceae bacterium]|nr:ABC transporter ATP-binding protein [Streptosporangiaceae bacterium]